MLEKEQELEREQFEMEREYFLLCSVIGVLAAPPHCRQKPSTNLPPSMRRGGEGETGGGANFCDRTI